MAMATTGGDGAVTLVRDSGTTIVLSAEEASAIVSAKIPPPTTPFLGMTAEDHLRRHADLSRPALRQAREASAE